MAAIDPSEEPELENAVDKQKVRSTLKVVRVMDDGDDSEDDDFDEDEMDEDEESDDEEAETNGGPSKVPSKKDILKAIADAEAEDDDEDEEDDDDEEEGDSEDDAAAEEILSRLMKQAKKGKSKALNGEDEDSDDDDAESLEMDEVVVCTLDPEKVCSLHNKTIKQD